MKRGGEGSRDKIRNPPRLFYLRKKSTPPGEGNKMDKLELLYAKLSFRLNTDKRMAVCRKLASLLRNNFTLMDALGRIERAESKNGAKPNEPFAIVMRQWQKNLERGMPLHEATRGWIPMTETLLLTVGDVSKLDVALANIDRVMTGTERIRRAMLGAIAYPLFLLVQMHYKHFNLFVKHIFWEHILFLMGAYMRPYTHHPLFTVHC